MEPTRTISQLVNEIRSEYLSEFCELNFNNIRLDCSSTLESWICDLIEKYPERSIYQEWREILEGIDVTEFEHLELFHYTDFSVIYGEWNPEDYWNAFGGIYRTCRSTVIDLETGVTVIKPFDKFFNVNELSEASQDIVSKLIEQAKLVEISDKLDGSIACFSARHAGTGSVSTKVYSCTSQSLNPETSWHLRDAQTFFYGDQGLQKLVLDHIGWTFMFEMISKEDAHVVYYPESEYGLHLIGVRDSMGDLLTYDRVICLANQYGVKTTRVFDKSFEQVVSELDSKTSDEAEGFVIRVDGKFFKLKYNDYVAMHKVINRLASASAVIEAYKEGRIDDLVSKVPMSYKQQVNDIVNEIKMCISEVNRVAQYAEKVCSGIPEFRDKMIWIQRNIPKILASYCFDAVKGNPVSVFKKGRSLKLSVIRTLFSAAYRFMENANKKESSTSSAKARKMTEYEAVYGGGLDRCKYYSREGEFFNF